MLIGQKKIKYSVQACIMGWREVVVKYTLSVCCRVVSIGFSEFWLMQR